MQKQGAASQRGRPYIPSPLLQATLLENAKRIEVPSLQLTTALFANDHNGPTGACTAEFVAPSPGVHKPAVAMARVLSGLPGVSAVRNFTSVAEMQAAMDSKPHATPYSSCGGQLRGPREDESHVLQLRWRLRAGLR